MNSSNIARIFLHIFTIMLFGGTISFSNAEVKLHSLFTDNMVLQRDKPAPVWGTASPNEKVTVTIGAQTKSTQADANGKWLVTLDPMPTALNQTLVVKGTNEIDLKNVAIGDVFLCSGQSNMAFGVNFFNDSAKEQAAAKYPDIRLFTVPTKITAVPLHDLAAPTQWQVCSPDTVLQFSATAYYFGRDMHLKLGVPIGLLASTVGGTSVLAWMSPDALLKRPDTHDSEIQTAADIVDQAKGTFPEQMRAWWKNVEVGIKNNWQTPDFDDSKWKTIKVPSPWNKTEIGDYGGAAWFRHQIQIPAAWAGKDLVLRLGPVGDRDTVFFNGTEVSDDNSVVWYTDRKYTVPGSLVKAGTATIAIGVVNTGTGGYPGISGQAGPVTLSVAGDAPQTMDLAGDWKYSLGVDPKVSGPPPRFVVGNPADAGRLAILYNSMIAPLAPFAVRATIWYQGESDAERASQYQTLFPDMIRDWRNTWHAKPDGSDFGFYFVQLPNFIPPAGQDWVAQREAQAMALKLPHTGMITTIDIGDPGNIHPGNKQDVGKRLMLLVLAKEYGDKTEYAGPQFSAVKIDGSKARVEFTHAEGLKTTDGTAPKSFSLQGADDKWYPANAVIDGQAVVVSSDQAPAPKAVRYAWENSPAVNLINSAGLPTTPFRTDGTAGTAAK